MTSIHITFMRHGRSAADDEEVCEGRYDAPLTEVGRQQITRRGKEWRAAGKTFDLIVASTLTRASESAEIVGGILDIEVELEPQWMERDNGPLAGVPRAEVQDRFPLPVFRNPFEALVPSAGEGESDWEIYGRAARALQGVVRRGEGRYLVVAHGDILNSALRCVVGAQPAINRIGIHFALGDGGFAETEYEPTTNNWVLHALDPGMHS